MNSTNIFIDTNSEKITDEINNTYSQYGTSLFSSDFFKGSELLIHKAEILRATCFSNRKDDIKTIALYYHHLGVGGVQTCLRLFSKIFNGAGFHVVIITDEQISDELDTYGFEKKTKFVSIIHEKKNISSFDLNYRAKRWSAIIKEYDIDVIHYSSYENESLISDILSIRSSKAYIVLHMHSVFSCAMAMGNPQKLEYCIQAYQFVDALVTLSRESQFFFNSLGIKSYYIPNPPTFSKEQATGPREHPTFNRIIWCGRISPEKQILEAIKIFAEAKSQVPTLKLSIVGDCVMKHQKIKKEAIELAKKLNCFDAIEWVGFTKDVHSYFNCSDILLSTSCIEGFGMTFIEAYSVGIPLVIYNLKSIATIDSNLAAHPIPQLNHKLAARKIVQLLTDRDLYKKSSSAAYSEYCKFASLNQTNIWKNLFLSLPKTTNEHKNEKIDTLLLSNVLLTLIEHSKLCQKATIKNTNNNNLIDSLLVKTAIKLQKSLNIFISLLRKIF